jgi:hypothetical protein
MVSVDRCGADGHRAYRGEGQQGHVGTGWREVTWLGFQASQKPSVRSWPSCFLLSFERLASRKASRLLTTIVLTGSLMLSVTSCGLFEKTKVVKHPDAPMLIIGGSGTVTVAVWDSSSGGLIEYGTVDVSELSGWTVGKFDWGAER